MNEANFQVKNALVVAVNPNAGIWVQFENGSEDCYQVNSSFHCREGHRLTVVLHDTLPIMLLNETTNMKIQLRTGADILGNGSHAAPVSGQLLLGIFFMLVCPPFGLLLLVASLFGAMWLDVLGPFKELAGFLRKASAFIKATWKIIVAFAAILGIAYWLLPTEIFTLLAFCVFVIGGVYGLFFHHRIRGFIHKRKIKAADKIIDRMFQAL